MRIYCNYRRAKPVTKEVICSDPYAIKSLRKMIDACAFKIYGHWVKKGQTQNRAALFENTPKFILLSIAAEENDTSLRTLWDKLTWPQNGNYRMDNQMKHHLRKMKIV